MRKNALIELMQEALATLADAEQPWVSRRDAADVLGGAAAHAVSALKSREDEADPDVRIAVERGLGAAQAALQGIRPQPLEKEGYTLAQLARACEKADRRTVAPHGDGFAIDVAIGDTRRQRVLLDSSPAKNGGQLVRVSTVCGAPSEKAIKWALRLNLEFTHGALALSGGEGQEQLVMTCSFRAEDTGPDEIKDAVKEIAFYGDWIEAKLSGKDIH